MSCRSHVILIILALYLVWRMHRLEKQLEDVHISLRKILALPLDLRRAEDVPSSTKQLTAGQRRVQLILRWLFVCQYRKQTLIERYGADMRLPNLHEEIAQCRHRGMHDTCMVRYADLVARP